MIFILQFFILFVEIIYSLFEIFKFIVQELIFAYYLLVILLQTWKLDLKLLPLENSEGIFLKYLYQLLILCLQSRELLLFTCLWWVILPLLQDSDPPIIINRKYIDILLQFFNRIQ